MRSAAYRRGRRRFTDGPLDDHDKYPAKNPYQPGSDEHRDWQAGWDAAEGDEIIRIERDPHG